MTEVEKELERFIASGKATTSIDNSGFQTTHIDPLKIAKHFAQWQREQMMKGAIDAQVSYLANERTGMKNLRAELPMGTKLDFGEKVKVIILKE